MEKMIITQERTGWGDVQKSFGATDELPESEVPDAMEKFLADCHLRAVGVDPAGLAKETAGIERRAAEIIRKTHFAGAKTAPDPALKVARVEKTKYPTSGKTVVAEFDERGVCTRTYIEGE